jgi:hypothetical protein
MAKASPFLILSTSGRGESRIGLATAGLKLMGEGACEGGRLDWLAGPRIDDQGYSDSGHGQHHLAVGLGRLERRLACARPLRPPAKARLPAAPAIVSMCRREIPLRVSMVGSSTTPSRRARHHVDAGERAFPGELRTNLLAMVLWSGPSSPHHCGPTAGACRLSIRPATYRRGPP